MRFRVGVFLDIVGLVMVGEGASYMEWFSGDGHIGIMCKVCHIN